MIDAHHHIWRQADLPWLLGPERPRIFGPYAAIKRDYRIEEYLADIAGLGIEKSVYVQANWAPNWAADEAAWVQSVAEAHGWPHAIVGYADFTVADVRPQLDRLAAQPLMRGVRQQLHWHENPLYRFARRPDLAEDPVVQANIARLAEYDWIFELQVFAPQMAGAAMLACACPEVTFVLQHAGMLEDLSAEGRALWRDGMEELAACPNVVAKLSGFGTFIHRNDPAFVAEMVEATLALFGPKRCLYGSNFPIEKIWTPYADLLAGFRAAFAERPKTHGKAAFTDTAARVYRL
ncbi:MAG: amidohydrolase family protein [Pseudomonadota bacterium]